MHCPMCSRQQPGYRHVMPVRSRRKPHSVRLLRITGEERVVGNRMYDRGIAATGTQNDFLDVMLDEQGYELQDVFLI